MSDLSVKQTSNRAALLASTWAPPVVPARAHTTQAVIRAVERSVRVHVLKIVTSSEYVITCAPHPPYVVLSVRLNLVRRRRESLCDLGAKRVEDNEGYDARESGACKVPLPSHRRPAARRTRSTPLPLSLNTADHMRS
jgi:hypothetical protein